MNTERQLTVADVLKRPLFRGAEVIAGSHGLNRPVRWVHVVESPENLSFLNGGELILSTGVGFGEAAEKRRAYLTGLIQKGAVGVCMELGPYIPHIPDDMKEMADHYQFPLIVFPKPVRFVDITLDLHEHIINRHLQSLRSLETYARTLQQLTLRTSGLSRLLMHLQATVKTQTFYYPLDGPPLFAPVMPQTVQTEIVRLFDAALAGGELSDRTYGVLTISDKKQILYQPIVAMGHVLAYLGIILYEREADEILTLTLDYTASAIAQILLRRMFAEERSLDSQSRVIEDILQGRLKHDEELQTLLGLSRSAKPFTYVTMVMEVSRNKQITEDEAEVPFHDLLGIFRLILNRLGFRAFMQSRGSRLYLLLLSGTGQKLRRQVEKAMEEMKQTCRNTLGEETELRFGVSRTSAHLSEADRHFLEADQVLSLGKPFPSPFFDDLGVFRLLLQVRDRYALESFVADYLGPLVRHEEKHGGQLLETLRVFLEHQGNKQETAEALYISRQTLYHRLDKISECIGGSWTDADFRLCLQIALVIRQWLEQTGQQTPA